MNKAEKVALTKMSPEELIEGFVREAKLSYPGAPTSVREMNAHVDNFYAYADEIARRGGLPSLLPLLDSSDDWIAYRTASRLARNEETKDRAMATLDRIADSDGEGSGQANRARNMIRYNDPLGEPVAVEKRLAAIRAEYGDS